MKKILVVGTGHFDNGDLKASELYLTSMKEKYGDDIVLVTPEEAKEQGLTSKYFDNIPVYKIEAPKITEQPYAYDFKSGRQNRRERRAKKRKQNKK